MCTLEIHIHNGEGFLVFPCHLYCNYKIFQEITGGLTVRSPEESLIIERKDGG